MKISLQLMSVIGMIGLLAFANYSIDQTICENIEIQIDRSNDNYFIEEEDIFDMVYFEMDTIVGRLISEINTNRLEHKLNNHSAIQKTEVYKTIDGNLMIEVQQRTPIVRIYNQNGESFYLDSTGKVMPPSASYTSRVLIASGEIHENISDIMGYNFSEIEDSLSRKTNLDDLYKLSKFIRKEPFWSAQIEQLYVNKDYEIELIPRVGNHRIVLGDAAFIQEKFDKLKIFYFKGLSKTGWNEFSVVNLKYANQVVCTKI